MRNFRIVMGDKLQICMRSRPDGNSSIRDTCKIPLILTSTSHLECNLFFFVLKIRTWCHRPNIARFSTFFHFCAATIRLPGVGSRNVVKSWKFSTVAVGLSSKLHKFGIVCSEIAIPCDKCRGHFLLTPKKRVNLRWLASGEYTRKLFLSLHRKAAHLTWA